MAMASTTMRTTTPAQGPVCRQPSAAPVLRPASAMAIGIARPTCQTRAVMDSATMGATPSNVLLSFHQGIGQGINDAVTLLRPTKKPLDPTATMRAEQARYLTKRVAQLESAAQNAVMQAREQAQRSSEVACMNTALRHTNANLTQALKEEQQHRIELKIRLQKLKANGARGFDVNCDPAVERAAHMIVKSEELADMQAMIVQLRQEAVLLRSQVVMQTRRADECLAGKKQA